jgi:hypothetical protein
MPLVDVELLTEARELPCDVQTFLREAQRRIEEFQRDRIIPSFVPSDFGQVFAVLETVARGAVSPGMLFCEWGSGFGVVTCMAAMLEFDAWGIEIEAELVDHAQQLAADFDLPVEFVCGSFIPAQSEDCFKPGQQFTWLNTDTGRDDDHELGPADFDVIFAYPWPDEEMVVENLFERHASPGSLLVTYHGGDQFRLQRKKLAKLRRQRKR